MNLHTDVNTTGSSARITRNHITFADRVKMIEEMRKVISVRNDGKCTYAKGWSDERVAKDLLAGRATLLNVINLRKQVFGTLSEYKRGPSASNSNMTRITKLELRIGKLEEQLGLLTQLLQMFRHQGKL